MAEKQRLNIGSKLRQLRESRGLEINDVAKILGMKRERYNHYEVDAREPSLDTVVKLANFYGVSVDYLLGVTDVPSQSTPKGEDVSFPELLTKIYFQIDEETKHQLMDTMCKFINQIGRDVKPLSNEQLIKAKELESKYSTKGQESPPIVMTTPSEQGEPMLMAGRRTDGGVTRPRKLTQKQWEELENGEDVDLN